jgi:quercetin dioxygenase-like cupin family protein
MQALWVLQETLSVSDTFALDGIMKNEITTITTLQVKLSAREYNKAVESGEFPADPTVPIDDVFKNDAGSIINLVFHKGAETRPSGVEIIHSKKNAIRSNHYHKTDWHYMYVVEGEMTYFWRPVDRPYGDMSAQAPRMRVYKKGEMMFTPPLVEHASFFNEDTILLVISHNVRDKEHHEADLVRKRLVTVEFDALGAPVLKASWD